MALYFEPPRSERPGLGESLAQGVGNALGGIVQGKIGQMQRANLEQQLLKGGLAPQDVALLSAYPPEIQVKLLGQLFQRGPAQGGVQGQTQAMGQPGEQPNQIPGQSSFYQAPLREQREERKVQIAEDKLANQENAPYNASFEKRIHPAVEFKTTLDQAKELFKQPDLQLGAVKSLIPNRFQNAQTQAFLAKLQELVTLKSQLGRGVASKQRLLQEALSKPQAYQHPETIGYLLNSFDEALYPLLQEEQIRQQIVENNGGRQPRGFESKVKKWAHAIKNLPPAIEYSPDAEIKVNGKRFRRAGDTWMPLDVE